MTRHLKILLFGLLTLAGCGKEPPPRSVIEFVENPILLEAAMVRCAEDRSKSRYDAECVNARMAVARIQAGEEAARKSALEASSEKKRNELRRRQEAVAEARRRAAEAERLRKEAEYLAQFGISSPADGETAAEPSDVVVEGGAGVASPSDGKPDAEAALPVVPDPEAAPPVSDLESIRDELRRRNEEPGD